VGDVIALRFYPIFTALGLVDQRHGCINSTKARLSFRASHVQSLIEEGIKEDTIESGTLLLMVANFYKETEAWAENSICKTDRTNPAFDCIFQNMNMYRFVVNQHGGATFEVKLLGKEQWRTVSLPDDNDSFAYV